MFKFYCKGFCSETALKKKKVISFIRHDPAHAEMFTIVSGLKVKQMALRCCSVLICWKSVLSSKCSVVHTQQSQLVFTLGLRPLEVHILLKATTLSLALKPCVKIGVWQHDSGFLFFFSAAGAWFFHSAELWSHAYINTPISHHPGGVLRAVPEWLWCWLRAFSKITAALV